MKISVITPAYNAETYLPKTLDSVLNQTLPSTDYEVIVVNNSSTDRTLEILEKYRKMYPNLTYVSQENRGPAGGRNRGMEMARGEFFFFLDADDILPENALDRLYDTAVSRKADLVVAGYQIFDGVNTHKVGKLGNLTRRKVISPLDPDLVWTFSLWNKLFRAGVIRKSGMKFPDLIYSEDGVFVMEFISRCGLITGLDLPVLTYRKMAFQASSITASFSEEKFSSFLEAHRRIRSILEQTILRTWPMEEKNGIKAVCAAHPQARTLLEEFSYKQLYTLIDQFYIHIWAMDTTTREKVCGSVRSQLHQIDDRGYIRTIQQWYDLDFGRVGKEYDVLRRKPLMDVWLYAEDPHGEDFLKTVRCLAFQDMVFLRVLLPLSAREAVASAGLLHDNMFFIDAADQEAFQKAVSSHANIHVIGARAMSPSGKATAIAAGTSPAACISPGQTFAGNEFRTRFRRLQVPNNFARVLSRARREWTKWLFLLAPKKRRL